MGKAIGIDLGTTNTAVAVLVDGRPRVLEDEKGYKVLPSCVSLKDDGKFIVGQTARNLVITQPERTAYAVKRLIGRRFDSPEVDESRRRMSYGISAAPDGSCLVSMGDQQFTPVEVSALILQVARGIAERALDDQVDEAVITVPAYFNHQQRSSTLEAARLAGLRCDRLLNEPTAAALAYGFRRDVERTVAIYDLGGGTFDVSVLHMSRGVYEILSTSGDTYLGGEDFDFRMVDYLADHFQSNSGVDLRQDLQALQRLKDAAERAKCELSFTDRTTVLVPRITPTDNLEVAVSRLTLESLVDDLVDRSLQITRKAVNDAGLQLNDIDDVILVGGQTRMPRVREAISELFQKEPSRGVHPEEVVAVGAAVHANSLSDPDAAQPLLLDVTPFDLGIDVAGGLFQPVIPRNSHIPAAASRIFATAHDNQDSVRVTVRQGDSRFSTENEFLGQFIMSGLSPAPRMHTKVEITFRIDSNGMLHCTAVEPHTGERKRITVRNYAEVAGTEGQVEARLDGDAEEGPPPTPSGPDLGMSDLPEGDQAGESGPPEAAAKPKKKGFFGGLFGGGKSKPAKKAAPAPQSAPEPAPSVPEEPPPVVELPADALNQVEPTPIGGDELVALPEDAVLDAVGPGRLDEDDTDSFDAGRMGAAAVGMAGAGIGFDAMDNDEESMMPVGMQDNHDDDVEELEDEDFYAMPLEDEGSYDEEQWNRSASLHGESTSNPARDPNEPAPPMLPDDGDFGLPEAPSGMGADEDPFRMPSEQSLMGLTGQDVAKQPEQAGEGLEQSDTEMFHLPGPDDASTPAPADARRRRRRRKPAKLKLAYRKADAMVAEYRENLRRGGCFVKTTKPLPVGRECEIEVRAPSMGEPLVLSGVVTWSSADQASLPPGHDPGMGIEYRMDERRRREVERLLSSLV